MYLTLFVQRPCFMDISSAKPLFQTLFGIQMVSETMFPAFKKAGSGTRFRVTLGELTIIGPGEGHFSCTLGVPCTAGMPAAGPRDVLKLSNCSDCAVCPASTGLLVRGESEGSVVVKKRSKGNCAPYMNIFHAGSIWIRISYPQLNYNFDRTNLVAQF